MPTTKCGFDDGSSATGRDLLVSLGPTLYVFIGFDPAFRPDGTNAPNVPVTPIEALVDTGAATSCVDTALATSLNLPIVDRQTVAGVQGSFEANIHLAQIVVPTLGHTIHGQFYGVNLVAGGQRHMALIGRTFLQHFTMTYEGTNGTVTLSDD